MLVLVLLLIGAALCGGFGAYVAAEKGRGAVEGLLFGFMLGPIGILIVAILPSVEDEPVRPSRPRSSRRSSGYAFPAERIPDREPDPDEDAAFEFLTGLEPKTKPVPADDTARFLRRMEGGNGA